MTERKSVTITWRIKKFSFCWQEKEEELSGPTFFIEGMEGCKWILNLFPQATKSKKTGNIACYFYLEKEENGPEEVEIDYELSVLGCDGLPIVTAAYDKIKMKGNEWSSPLLLPKYTVFFEKPDEFLPKDSLTVRCRIWKINQESINAERHFATTQIEIEKASLFGIVKKTEWPFYGQRYQVQFISVSTEASPIFINVRVIEGTPYAEIHPANYESIKFCRCELHFTDDTGNEIVYGQDEYLFHFDTIPLEGDMQVWTFPLEATSKYDDSQPYPELQNLTLRCEVTYSIGITSEKFEKIDYSISTFKNGCRLKEKRQKQIPSLKDDMLCLMRNTENSDIQIRTENKTFPAHSIILRTRSLFFRKKLDQIKKQISFYVTDLDNETLYQMLVFLYTDTIENLESKNAMKLYIASELYGIPLLKHRCSCFLQDNLDTSICCDVLQAADKYQDNDLKKAALSYILEHEEEVIGSDKWKDLERFTELTEEVLYLKRINS
ncbi:unnamed protein product [Larinioides sclopetarius]|uniref:Speckle-type POZ protein n=1 Tax=Larinioides sclopetarius TaxID=280406 RepID=A0AAV1YXB9_9ARAC